MAWSETRELKRAGARRQYFRGTAGWKRFEYIWRVLTGLAVSVSRYTIEQKTDVLILRPQGCLQNGPFQQRKTARQAPERSSTARETYPVLQGVEVGLAGDGNQLSAVGPEDVLQDQGSTISKRSTVNGSNFRNMTSGCPSS